MNQHELKGNWKQLKGKVQRRWGRLTDNDLDIIDGNRKVLVGRIQERYGEERSEIEKDVDSWFDSLSEKV